MISLLMSEVSSCSEESQRCGQEDGVHTETPTPPSSSSGSQEGLHYHMVFEDLISYSRDYIAICKAAEEEEEEVEEEKVSYCSLKR